MNKIFIIDQKKVIRKKTTLKPIYFQNCNLYSCKGCDALSQIIMCKPEVCFAGWKVKFGYILKRIE